jgi:hypothetical protein
MGLIKSYKKDDFVDDGQKEEVWHMKSELSYLSRLVRFDIPRRNLYVRRGARFIKPLRYSHFYTGINSQGLK